MICLFLLLSVFCTIHCQEIRHERLSPEQYQGIMENDISLGCGVDTQDAQSVLWFRKGNHNEGQSDTLIAIGSEVLENGPKYYIDTSGFPHDLGIAALSENDEGIYICEAIISQNVSITVESELRIIEKPVIEHIAGEYSVQLGDTTKLVCSATGYPKPKISWHFKGNCTFNAFLKP